MSSQPSARNPRHATVIRAAAAEARLVGLPYITKRAVARRAGVPSGSLQVYGSMADIKREVLTMDPSLGEAADRYVAGRAERDAGLLAAALAAAAAGNYQTITRNDVADRAGVSPGTVSNWAGSMDGMRRLVMTAAAGGGHAAVLAQGLACNDPIALAASDELKAEARESLR